MSKRLVGSLTVGQGKQGPPGPQGPQGPVGPVGPPGPQGSGVAFVQVLTDNIDFDTWKTIAFGADHNVPINELTGDVAQLKVGDRIIAMGKARDRDNQDVKVLFEVKTQGADHWTFTGRGMSNLIDAHTRDYIDNELLDMNAEIDHNESEINKLDHYTRDEVARLDKRINDAIIGGGGTPGPEGPRGPEGPQGPPGPQGQRGRTGDTGAVGPQGPIGPQGLQGQAGPEGPKGDRGIEGPQGPTGLTGPIGPQGATGPQGIQGPKGDRGDTGFVRVQQATNSIDTLWTEGFWRTNSGTTGTFPPASRKDGILQTYNQYSNRWTQVWVDSIKLEQWVRTSENKSTWTSWNNISENNKYITKADNNKCQNVNDCKESGRFYTAIDTQGDFPNGLINNQKAGILEVDKYIEGSSTFVAQRFTQIRDGNTNNRVWTRVWDHGPTWGQWKKLLNEDDSFKINQCDNLDNCKKSGTYKTTSRTTGVWPVTVLSTSAPKEAVLEVIEQGMGRVTQRLTTLDGEVNLSPNNVYTRAFFGNKWTAWERLLTRENVVLRYDEYRNDINDFKPDGGGISRTSNSTRNLPQNCNWGTIIFLAESKDAPITGGTQQYISNAGPEKGSMFVRALEGGQWGPWHKLLFDASINDIRNSLANKVERNDLNTQLTPIKQDIQKIKGDLNNKVDSSKFGRTPDSNNIKDAGHMLFPDNFIIEWNTATPGGQGFIEFDFRIHHVRDVYSWTITPLDVNNPMRDHEAPTIKSILLEGSAGDRTIRVRANKGGYKYKLTIFGHWSN